MTIGQIQEALERLTTAQRELKSHEALKPRPENPGDCVQWETEIWERKRQSLLYMVGHYSNLEIND